MSEKPKDKDTELIYGVYSWQFHEDVPLPMVLGREAQREPWWHLLVYYGSMFLVGLVAGLLINWILK